MVRGGEDQDSMRLHRVEGEFVSSGSMHKQWLLTSILCKVNPKRKQSTWSVRRVERVQKESCQHHILTGIGPVQLEAGC